MFLRHRYWLPGRERVVQVECEQQVRRTPRPVAVHVGREQRHDGRYTAAARADGRVVPRRLLQE